MTIALEPRALGLSTKLDQAAAPGATSAAHRDAPAQRPGVGAPAGCALAGGLGSCDAPGHLAGCIGGRRDCIARAGSRRLAQAGGVCDPHPGRDLLHALLDALHSPDRWNDRDALPRVRGDGVSPHLSRLAPACHRRGDHCGPSCFFQLAPVQGLSRPGVRRPPWLAHRGGARGVCHLRRRGPGVHGSAPGGRGRAVAGAGQSRTAAAARGI